MSQREDIAVTAVCLHRVLWSFIPTEDLTIRGTHQRSVMWFMYLHTNITVTEKEQCIQGVVISKNRQTKKTKQRISDVIHCLPATEDEALLMLKLRNKDFSLLNESTYFTERDGLLVWLTASPVGTVVWETWREGRRWGDGLQALCALTLSKALHNPRSFGSAQSPSWWQLTKMLHRQVTHCLVGDRKPQSLAICL